MSGWSFWMQSGVMHVQTYLFLLLMGNGLSAVEVTENFFFCRNCWVAVATLAVHRAHALVATVMACQSQINLLKTRVAVMHWP